MLQLRTTAAAARNGARLVESNVCSPNARPWMRLGVPGQQSKVGFRNSSLALKAHRGDEVAAFLVASDTQEADTLHRPPPSVVSRQLLVYTTEGAKASVTVLPGVTTVGQLRAQVAEATRTDPGQVRLSYAGKELPPSLDASLLALKPGIDVVAALQRFQGGGAASA